MDLSLSLNLTSVAVMGGGGGASGTVFGLIGQSNNIGKAPNDGGATYPPTLLEYTQAGELAAPSGGLDHVVQGSGEPSIALGFALKHQVRLPDETIVLVPCAVGLTGLEGDDWNPGDPAYNAAVARMNAVMAANPGFTFGGFLWHQGEQDGNANASATYGASLSAMVTAMRTAVTGAGATTPFVVGGLLPAYIADATKEGAEVDAVLQDVRSIIGNSAYATSAGLLGLDSVHFDAESLRILGGRYADAYVLAETGTASTDLVAVSSDYQYVTSSGATRTFSAMAHSTGNVVVAVGITDNSDISAETISGLTIGGQTATRLWRTNRVGSALEFWQATGVTGSSSDVVVTYDVEPPVRISVVMWALSAEAALVDDDFVEFDGLSESVTVDVPAGGLILAAQASQGSNLDATISFAGGASTGSIAVVENPASNQLYNGADRSYALAATGETVTASAGQTRFRGTFAALALEQA